MSPPDGRDEWGRGGSEIVKVVWIIIALGLGVASLPLFWDTPVRQTSLNIPIALSWSSDKLIAEGEAIERCETALKLARRGGEPARFTVPSSGPRAPLGAARDVRVAIVGKNSRDIELDLVGWCRVWSDGKTAIVRMIETSGKDYLASSYPINVRDSYLERVKVSKMQIAVEGLTGTITNRNDFPIKAVVVSCRQSAEASEATTNVDRIIPAGGSARIVVPRAGSQSPNCRAVDFMRVGTAELRLIEVFGASGGQAALARLRQDAIRVNASVEDLVEPYVELTRALASNRH